MKKISFLILPIIFLGCVQECPKDESFRPHKVRHCNKSKIYYYYHNDPCDCNGINKDLCLDCHYQKTYVNYVEYYDTGERVYGK